MMSAATPEIVSTLYASEIAAQAMRLAPEGLPHKAEEMPCAMCGRPIHEGDLSVRYRPGKGFTNQLSMTPSDHICGWCNATIRKESIMQLQQAVITPRGIYSLGKDVHRAWFLLTPPQPPYVVVISLKSAMAATHLHWRTPVTLSNELVVLRIGDDLTRIRRRVLMRALEAAPELLSEMDKISPPPAKCGKGETLRPKHPFESLSRTLDGASHGRLRQAAWQVGQARPELLEPFMDLTSGELWALSTLAKSKADKEPPLQPELITAPKPPKATKDEE